MKQFTILVVILISLSCNQKNANPGDHPKGTFSTDTSGDKLYTTTLEDTGMNNAISAAKENLALFDKALKSGNSNFEFFAIKKRFAAGESGEHIWINQIQFYKDGYKGVINNDPVIVKEIKLGDTVYVSKNDISDWMYLDKNVLRGGYTMRFELKKMAPDERAAFLKNLDYKIEE